jgi:two-component system, NtrC family, response regulator HydG
MAEAVACAVGRREPGALITALEESARALVTARHVRIRPADVPDPRALRSEPAAGQALAIKVPTPDGERAVRMEAGPEAGSAFDDWDVQALALAGQLAALVVEIERLRAHPRLGGVQVPKARRDGAAPIIGSTSTMQALRDKIERVAITDFTVLIEGESGTGKELVAQQIHTLSHRSRGPFVAINCAALVETLIEAELFGIEERTATGVRGRRGKFEHAHAGTLFLDEVSDLSLSAQAKLLRAIQDLSVERVGGQGAHRVDIRIVAATNRSLSRLVTDGLFRSDLFYRLSGVEITVPPLRTRQTDILELANYFLERYRQTRRLDLSQSAGDALLAHQWPGNVRELERVIEGVVALAQGDRVELDDLPPSIRGDYETILGPSIVRDDSLKAWAHRYSRLVLQRCNQNKRQACRILGISYHTLQTYLRQSEQAAQQRGERPPWHGQPVAGPDG